jgi:enediyne biosynthesis protein E4
MKLEQDGPNRDAVGAWIEVRRGDVTMRREATSGGGHVSGQTGWWHFGLGDRDEAEIRVIWPDGAEGDWTWVAADGFYVLARDTEPVAWKPNGR